MNDNAIKNYAIWARRELMSEVEKRCAWWGIAEGARADLDSVDGRVLSQQERRQREGLLRIVQADGYAQLVERAAYTWFNRMLAIRFMEVNDRLPSHVRVLSSADGAFEPQCLREAMDLPLEALDKDEAVRLVQSGDDEALFRLVFLAQCAELAECMPAVFEPVGSAMELLLPTGLLRADGVVGRLVSDIPEDDWRGGVEIVGWMYQYYVSERKDEVFASFKKGKKAERDAIAPATQLFTPHWIVRYLTENSLGRLWMLNHPDSKLVERMPYYVKPDEEHETEFRRVSSPEEITVVDPACGSGHILVYAFDLLATMYEEVGYSNRDAAQLILQKNLTGLEIDPRAAAMASFALTMKACELDSRFLRRGLHPKITVLNRIELISEELALCPNVAERQSLVDVASHLDECGSLFQPEGEDIVAIERDLASLAGESSLFASSAVEKLERLQIELRPLTESYDVVVANPPYMGGKNMNRWLGDWVKSNYADVKGDMFSCFIVRNLAFGSSHAQLGFMTPYVWMFIGTYEKLRKLIIAQHTITSLIQLEYSGFAGATVPICTFTLQKGNLPDYKGGYIRLSDFVGADNQAPKVLEALADPECSWFYRRSANAFETIPSSPIAYWVSEAMVQCFNNPPINKLGRTRRGLQTGDSPRFIRKWFEVSVSGIHPEGVEYEGSSEPYQWFFLNSGGPFRRWYGNLLDVVNWHQNGEAIKNTGHAIIPSEDLYFKPVVSWNKISSGIISVRYQYYGVIPGDASPFFIGDSNEKSFLFMAIMNSSSAVEFCKVLSPTLNYEVGTIAMVPSVPFQEDNSNVVRVVWECVMTAKVDWNTLETSWGFKGHPLL